MNSGKKINTKLLKIKNEVGFWLGLISSIIALAEFFYDLPLWLRIGWICCLSIFIVVVIIDLVIWIKKNFSIKEELTSQHSKHLNCISEKMHVCLHQIKDYICYDKDYLSNKQFFSGVCQIICNNIEKVFVELWDDKEVSVCMKRIIVNNETDKIGDWEVRTIARSSNANQNRRQMDNKNYKIIDNKDFYVIASPEYKDSIFSSPNMEKVKADFIEEYGIEYSNTTPNYLKYYKSALVVPIRISFENAHKKIKEMCTDPNTTYNIIGFLCIDSTKKYDNDLSNFIAGAEIARALADSLYKLFENNYIYTVYKEEDESNEKAS